MTSMIGAIIFGRESPSEGAVEFAERWNAERDTEAIPGYRLPSIQGGVGRAESVALFEEYVDRHPDGGAMVEWARTLAMS
jgi:hypothetical protein